MLLLVIIIIVGYVIFSWHYGWWWIEKKSEIYQNVNKYLNKKRTARYKEIYEANSTPENYQLYKIAYHHINIPHINDTFDMFRETCGIRVCIGCGFPTRNDLSYCEFCNTQDNTIVDAKDMTYGWRQRNLRWIANGEDPNREVTTAEVNATFGLDSEGRDPNDPDEFDYSNYEAKQKEKKQKEKKQKEKKQKKQQAKKESKPIDDQARTRKKYQRITCPHCGAFSKVTKNIEGLQIRKCKNNHEFVYNYKVESAIQDRYNWNMKDCNPGGSKRYAK